MPKLIQPSNTPLTNYVKVPRDKELTMLMDEKTTQRPSLGRVSHFGIIKNSYFFKQSPWKTSFWVVIKFNLRSESTLSRCRIMQGGSVEDASAGGCCT